MQRLVFVIIMLFFGSAVFGQMKKDSFDIKGTSLTELMSLKITSLSKKKQSLNRAPAAVYVLSSNEIERMGVTHIAEALRYVPGVEVARVDSSRWAISIRGFNSRAANKLLVMIDGRTIYSPFFSGVLWEEKDVVLEDVDRIEIIRGPGGAVWGANAVNGVINIITKHGNETVGSLVEGGKTSKGASLAQARQGWQLADTSYLRLYAKLRESQDTGGAFQNDDGQHKQMGFRFDHAFTADHHLTLQGDMYRGEVGSITSPDEPSGQEQHGGNFLINWEFQETANRRHQLQAFYDTTYLDTGSIVDDRDTFDVGYQVQQGWNAHDLVAGLGYRRVRDDIESLFIQPGSVRDETFNAFFQGDISFLNDDAHAIFGTKYETNDYSGTEWQPNVRFSYMAWGSLFWTSWSKAVRVPTRLETDITIPGLNGDDFDSEHATVYEFGWRKQWPDSWQLDLTLYQSDYDDLLSLEPEGLRNKISGTARGVEISASIKPIEAWLLRINASHAEMDLEADEDSFDDDRAQNTEDSLPQNLLQIASMLDINEDWQLNTYLRYVDSIATNNIDNYVVVDISLRWAINERLSANFTGRNLSDGTHKEWSTDAPVEDEYGVYVKWEL